MDPALGPPESMAESDELTPMIAQYVELCEQYSDALVLFHVGDFYKTFGDAAETVGRVCELTLITREDSTGEYTAAGIPVDTAESYVDRLLDAGYRVAIAEQVEDPEQVSGVADRAVTRVLTPGTLTEDELLEGDDNTYVAALASDDAGRHGIAFLDVSTGDFYVTGGALGAISDEVGRFEPAEAIVEPTSDDTVFPGDTVVSAFDEEAFEADIASEHVAEYFGAPDAHLETPAEVRATGALLAYAEYTRGGEDGHLDYLTHLTRYDVQEYMTLDAVALRSLELFDRRSVHGGPGGALIDVLDETASALGSRRLRDWIRRPLLDRETIEARLDAVEELSRDVRTRETIQEQLRDVYDLERLISRVSRGRANARDLRSLEETLAVVPEIRQVISDPTADVLQSLRDGLDDLGETRDRIERAIQRDPPVEITDGNVIREEYDRELDQLRRTERDGKEWIARLEARERERTGIDTLEVGHNAVHGYYIEVTDSNLDRIPAEYTRRQTLKNAERFYTPALKEREDEILRAEHRADQREYDLFTDVRSAVAAETERVQALAAALARLDAICALAEIAANYDYTRPEIRGLGAGIRIESGRHAVVERTQDSFVPNGIELDRSSSLAVITGPNMSGKSTYMRQIALITILAQIGSFVPAASADIGLVDRVYTRVGASDDIAGGQSTFMVEMTELADILESATANSLVLLDEVGRGTSTADGLALARAITEYLHDEIGAYTLFATHHHELTTAADSLSGLINLHFEVTRTDGDVRFDHDVSPGPATGSYGVDVARMAGVPDSVVDRSHELIATDESETAEPDALRDRIDTPSDTTSQLDDDQLATLVETLASVDIGETTPLDALNTLAELKRTIE